MPKRSARYTKALRDYEDALTSIEMVKAENRKVIETFMRLQAQKDATEKALKDVAKEEASKDEGFREIDTDQFRLVLTATRTVNDEKLQQLVPAKVYDRLATVKKYVTLESLTNAATLGVISEDILSEVIEANAFSAKLLPPAKNEAA